MLQNALFLLKRGWTIAVGDPQTVIRYGNVPPTVVSTETGLHWPVEKKRAHIAPPLYNKKAKDALWTIA